MPETRRRLFSPQSIRGCEIPRSGIILLVAAIAAVGCGDPGPNRGGVAGTVSLGGQGIAEGVIRFFPLDAGIGSDGPLSEGRYAIPAERGLSRGTYRVEISVLKPTGRRVPDFDAGPGDMKDEIIETVPARYNIKSELRIDYDPAAERSHDFQLTGSK